MRILRTNKKRKKAGFVIPLPFALVMVASSLSLGYLGLGVRCEDLGQELKRLEGESRKARERRVCEESRWANMKAPRQIEKTLIRHRLVMIWPRQDQIVFVATSGPSPGDAVQDRGIAATPRGNSMRTAADE
jgi:hypothetical protein